MIRIVWWYIVQPILYLGQIAHDESYVMVVLNIFAFLLIASFEQYCRKEGSSSLSPGLNNNIQVQYHTRTSPTSFQHMQPYTAPFVHHLGNWAACVCLTDIWQGTDCHQIVSTLNLPVLCKQLLVTRQAGRRAIVSDHMWAGWVHFSRTWCPGVQLWRLGTALAKIYWRVGLK